MQILHNITTPVIMHLLTADNFLYIRLQAQIQRYSYKIFINILKLKQIINRTKNKNILRILTEALCSVCFHLIL